MPLLRDALRAFAHGWRDDLPPGWRSALEDVEPDAAGVRGNLTFDPAEPIYPARRAHPLPAARADAHVLRAFDGLPPDRVRCVLLGQDPYPQIARATGRSFEQGNLDAWPTQAAGASVANILKTLMQMLASHRTGDAKYTADGGWTEVRRNAASGVLPLEPPRALFDRWQQQGVLCLNAGLTLTRYEQGGAIEQLEGHIPFWVPVVGRVLTHLAARSEGAVVFLLLGGPARALADTIGVRRTAVAADTWERSVDEVRLHHPAAVDFLQGANPFAEVNRRLVAMRADPIGW